MNVNIKTSMGPYEFENVQKIKFVSDTKTLVVKGEGIEYGFSMLDILEIEVSQNG